MNISLFVVVLTIRLETLEKMSNLIKSLRCFSAVKQSAGYMSVMQKRMESSKPPFPAPTGDNLKEPLQKVQEDPLADPKESCKKCFFSNI